MSVGDEVARILNDCGDLPRTPTTFLDREPVETANRLVNECVVGHERDPSMLEDFCWELIAIVSKTRIWVGKRGTGAPSWLGQARVMLNEWRTGVLPITTIAQKLGIHPVYFARSFRKHLHCSPAEYRMRCRLQRAMELLCRSDQSLSSIALDAGFFDQSHFTTTFRKHFGHAPGIYRGKLTNAGPDPCEVSSLQETLLRGGRS